MKKFSFSKSSLLALCIVLLSLVACTSSAQTPSVDLQSTNLPQQTSAAPPASLGDDCSNVYFPVYEGATWTYNQTGPAGPQTKIDTITDVGTDGFLVETTLTDSGGTINMVTTWTCTSDGLVMAQSDGGLFSAVAQGSGGNVTQTTLSNSGVTMPASFNAGDTWTQTTVVQVASSVINDTVTTTMTFKAVGVEQVTVPAGAFSAMRIDIHSDIVFAQGGSMAQDLTEWVVPEVGVVKTVNGASFGEDPEATVTAELVSYNIP